MTVLDSIFYWILGFEPWFTVKSYANSSVAKFEEKNSAEEAKVEPSL